MDTHATQLSAANMTDQERRANLTARFHAMSAFGDDTRPMVEIAGCDVTVYVTEGTLIVSLGFDAAPEWLLTRPYETVPVEIRAGGDVVWSSS